MRGSYSGALGLSPRYVGLRGEPINFNPGGFIEQQQGDEPYAAFSYRGNIRPVSEENDICATFGLTYKNCINHGTNTETCRRLFYYYKDKYNC